MKILELINIVLISVTMLSADTDAGDEIYEDENILRLIRKLSIEKLLEYESIADTMSSRDDKTRFYLMIATEFEHRIEVLDKNFYLLQKFYIGKINKYEHDLNLPVNQLNMIPIDLKYNQIPKNMDINYYKNKNQTKRAALIYIQKKFLPLSIIN